MTAEVSRRGWIPGAVAAATMVLGLWLLQLVTEVPAVAERAQRSRQLSGTTAVEGFLFDDLAYFGSYGVEVFQGPASQWVAIVAMSATVAVVCFLGTWWCVRGTRHRAAVTVFFAAWAVTVLAAAWGAYLGLLIRLGGDAFGARFVGQHGWALDEGATYGFSWGWVAAGAAALTWLVVSPREEPPAPAPGGASFSLPSGAPTAPYPTGGHSAPPAPPREWHPPPGQ